MSFKIQYEAYRSGHGYENGKGRVVRDGTTKIDPWDIVMNDYTSVDNEPEVTFGTSKTAFYWLIYNLRASYPDAPIF